MSDTVYISGKEACKRANIGRSTLYRYVEQGMPTIHVGTKQMFDEAEVRKWKEQKEINEKRGKRL